MGCCTADEEAKEKSKRSKMLDKELKADGVKHFHDIRLLLLGIGESGKSTLLKQMRIIHDSGYQPAELNQLRGVVLGNTVTSLKEVVDAMQDLSIEFDSEEHREQAMEVKKYPDEYGYDFLPESLVRLMQSVWSDGGVQRTLERFRTSQFHVNDSAYYFLSQLDRICSDAYIPTQADILRTRVKTTGVVEVSFKNRDLQFQVYDVGGQRSERRKWLHCFEDITAMIFCVALSEYDKVLSEDSNVNRMHEALRLFESICNCRFFTDTSIILFLNKRDLFEEKIGTSPLRNCFPEYTGRDNYEEASLFIQEKFEALNKRTNGMMNIYPQFTCATDTAKMRFVFDAVADIIIRVSLQTVGMF